MPYGKELASDGKTLVPSERDQKPLARIRRRHLGGMSVRAIAAKVTAESDRSRSGAAVSKSTVGRRRRG